MRIAGICASLGSAILIAACTTGGTPPNQMMQEGILCSTFYSVAGNFAPDTAHPNPNPDGCWPIGMWTFSLTKNTDPTMGGSADSCATDGHEPSPLTMYMVQGVEGTDQNGDATESFMYISQGTSDPNVNTSAKVTEGGPGCQGAFALYDTTGTRVWQMNPEMSDVGSGSQTISGTAEFNLYGSNQWNG